MSVRLILNGKKAGLPDVRDAIYQARSLASIDVRVTWESGDVERLVQEACAEEVSRLIIGGGDGSVKEVVDALLRIDAPLRPQLAILPLGTANDFATACHIPLTLFDALSFAIQGSPTPIDAVKANDEYFINVASGGFGAQVTTNTPVALKNFLGGGSYTLTGLIQAINFVPFTGSVTLPDHTFSGDIIVGAVCNGKQAGGGQQLAPHAKINDGLLDIVGLVQFTPTDAPQVLSELLDTNNEGRFVKRFQAPWIEWSSETIMPTNLDGEPIQAHHIRYDIVPNAIQLIIPEDSPVLN